MNDLDQDIGCGTDDTELEEIILEGAWIVIKVCLLYVVFPTVASFVLILWAEISLIAVFEIPFRGTLDFQPTYHFALEFAAWFVCSFFLIAIRLFFKEGKGAEEKKREKFRSF